MQTKEGAILARPDWGSISIPSPGETLSIVFAIVFGVAVTLCVQGYQFGTSNHTVYLLDAMRRVSPELLANDWFATRTLQYHTVFGWITAGLFRMGYLAPAFLIGYLALAVMLHVGWYLLTLRLGGSRMTYLLSVLLFHLSAGGLGLGMYQFLQDGSFLPSNVANVAMLWGIYLWITRRYAWAGLAFGVAGLFHLNHAVVCAGLWLALLLWQQWRPSFVNQKKLTPEILIGSAFVLTLCLTNVLFALSATVGKTNGMPLEEFVRLYVRLRHPHHYDPSSWPLLLWISFIWPIPVAVAAALLAKRREFLAPEPVASARIEASRIFLVLSGLLVVALIGAGIFYFSETLVQMSLYRFSIFIKLLSCIAAAYLLYDSGWLPKPTGRVLAIGIPFMLVTMMATLRLIAGTAGELIWEQAKPAGLFLAFCCAVALYELSLSRSALPKLLHPLATICFIVAISLGWGRWLGIGLPPDDNQGYLGACQWARNNTPVDATFLVPPDEELFRLHAQRAIVVNFKGVPQLSAEMGEWRDRLCSVLDLEDLSALPTPFHETLEAIQARYDELPAGHLVAAAHHYQANYLLTRRRLDQLPDNRLVYRDETGGCFLYDLKRWDGAEPATQHEEPDRGRSTDHESSAGTASPPHRDGHTAVPPATHERS